MKMTLSGLKQAAIAQVTADLQAGAFVASTDNILDLLDKIGKQVTIDGDYQDKLPEFDGDNLPLGKTIEEWFMDLTMPTDYDSTGATNLAPADPTSQTPSYSYTLGRKKIKTTSRFDDVERAMTSAENVASYFAKVLERLRNSESMYEYALKKQLLANFIAKAVTANLVQEVAIPTTTETGENFIIAVKEMIEAASFANEGNALNGTALIGAAPSLTLYVKKGVIPSLQVKTLAGAFNKDVLGIGATVKVLDDFGNADDDVYAVLLDPRGIKLHTGYKRMNSAENADGDFINHVLHSEFTGFLSKNTYVRVIKKPAEEVQE